MDNKTDPKASKCWDCKFGLCMSQENTSRVEANFPFIQPFMRPPQPVEEPEEKEWVWDEAEEETPPQSEEPKQVVESRVCSFCYWCPPNVKQNSPIIVVATVKDCSRHEKRD